MRPRCPVKNCPCFVTYDDVLYLNHCSTHGWLDCGLVNDFNNAEVQVWLRSRQVSYSKVLARGHLLMDGTVRAPGLEAFTWERWPS